MRITLLTFSLLLIKVSTAQTFQDSLIGWFPFSNSFLNEATNSAPNEISDVELVADRFGNANHAAHFSGGTYLEGGSFIDIGFFDLSASFTISGWYNLDEVPQAYSPGYTAWDWRFAVLSQLNHVTSYNDRYGIEFGPTNNYFGLHLDVQAGAVPDSLNWYGIPTVVNIESNQWLFFGFSYDAVTEIGSYYFSDGTIASQAMGYNYSSNESDHFYLGARPLQRVFVAGVGLIDAISFFMRGSIDDIAIWNRKLSSDEITMLSTLDESQMGCVDPQACNFSISAILDDGSCIFPVLGDDCNAGASVCGGGMFWNPVEQRCEIIDCPNCTGDLNNDGLISITDMLALLSVFGNNCPETGCTLEYAINFSSTAVTNDGSCIFPDCLNPAEPGTSCDDGLDSTYNDVWDDSGCMCVGTEYGPCMGQEYLDYAGYSYSLVEIGDQCWFAENLRTLVYANGDSIPTGLSNSEWQNTMDGAIFQNDGIVETSNVYGALYNGYAVQDSRKICPPNWRVSSDNDWFLLEVFLGIDSTEISTEGWRGIDEGSKLKSSNQDEPSWNGNNESGFSALPGGIREVNGIMNNYGYAGYWWTSSNESASLGWKRELNSSLTKINRGPGSMTNGFSVRCVFE